MGAQYEIYIYTAAGVLSDVLEDFLSLEYTLITNDIHALRVDVGGVYEPGEDARLEVYRDGALVGDTQFLVIGESVTYSAAGEMISTITAAGALKILDWPLVNIAPGLLKSHFNDYAGNVIKDLVRRNIGVDADDTSRDMSTRLAVQADANDGAAIELDFGWRRLWDAVRETAAASAENGTDLFFDVIKNSSDVLELRTYSGQRGTDRSASVILSYELGNLVDITRGRDYTTAASRAIVAGPGQELWRNVVEVANNDQVNNSPWGYIKEHLYATEEAKTAAAAVVYGEQYLRLNANRVTVSGRPLTGYGTDYNWGDLVTVEFLDEVAVVSVDRVQVTMAGGVEDVRIDLRGYIE